MRINSVSNFNFIQKQQSLLNKSYDCLKSDVFTKTNISFKSNIEQKDLSFVSFSNWALNSGYIDRILVDIENAKGEIIGEGAEGVIYAIPDTDNWVLKKYKKNIVTRASNDKTTIKQVRDVLPTMNIGQTIGQIEIPFEKEYSNVIYIRKKQSGFELGVGRNYSDGASKENIQTHLNTLKTLAEAPQSTYDKLIRDVKRLQDKGFEFDCYNTNNFLYDSYKQSINFVDVDNFFDGNDSQFGNILFALLDTAFYLSLDKEKPEENIVREKSKKYAIEIVNKFTQSMQQEKVNFDYTEIFTKLMNSDLLEEALNGKSKHERDSALRKLHLL